MEYRWPITRTKKWQLAALLARWHWSPSPVRSTCIRTPYSQMDYCGSRDCVHTHGSGIREALMADNTAKTNEVEGLNTPTLVRKRNKSLPTNQLFGGLWGKGFRERRGSFCAGCAIGCCICPGLDLGPRLGAHGNLHFDRLLRAMKRRASYQIAPEATGVDTDDA